MNESFDEMMARMSPGGADNPYEQPLLAYNPFRYVYQIPIEDLDITISLRFRVEDLNLKAKRNVKFNYEGKTYNIPVIPDGDIPSLELERPWEMRSHNQYEVGENSYHILPEVVGANRNGRLVDRSYLLEHLSPQLLQTALRQWNASLHQQIEDGKPVPAALIQVADMWGESASYRNDGPTDD